MKLSVLGAGYVGLVTGACFADLGNEVLVADVVREKIDLLQAGKVPFYEPGLEDVLERNIKEKRLAFTTDIASAARDSEMIIIAVGTPPNGNGEANLSNVLSAAETIGQSIEKDRVVVVMKSTVPVGTSKLIKEKISAQLAERGKKIEFAIASNPEFLKEGDAINDFMRPDRVVVGVEEEWAREIMARLYEPFSANGNPVLFMDIASSEMAKYAANAALAARISLMNELATIAEKLGADIEEVRKALAADSRIGKHFLYPGVGYGGSCFPKDVQALAASARGRGYTPVMIEAIETVNKGQRERFVEKIISATGGVKGKTIAVWGLAFKPGTDDMREAPSIHVIERLLAEGASITAYDPIASETAKKVFGDRVNYAGDMYECLAGATALVILTEWPQFKEPDFDKITSLLSEKLIVDGRNIYEPSRMQELGYRYFGIGRQ